MQDNILKVLFIADVVGQPGCDLVVRMLPDLIKQHEPDIVILNGENANNNAKGITLNIARRFIGLGVNVITGGNHTWENWHNEELFASEPKVIRPSNYPEGNLGKGYYIVEKKGSRVAVLNLQGRTYLYPIHCPFLHADKMIEELSHEADIVIIDFHAEATAEKKALGWYLDGKVAAVIGTHTHVQTADDRILPGGTAYITDTGMTGSHDSIIGMKIEGALHRFIYQTPKKFEVAKKNLRINGVIFTINTSTKKSETIARIEVP